MIYALLSFLLIIENCSHRATLLMTIRNEFVRKGQGHGLLLEAPPLTFARSDAIVPKLNYSDCSFSAHYSRHTHGLIAAPATGFYSMYSEEVE